MKLVSEYISNVVHPVRWCKIKEPENCFLTKLNYGWEFQPQKYYEYICASSDAASPFGSCKIVSSKERSVQKLDFFQIWMHWKWRIFDMAWSCLTNKRSAVVKLIIPGSWNGCGAYSPSGVKERTGLVSLLLSRLASRLQPWLTLGRGIRLPLADPPPRKHQEKSREKHKDKEEQKHWKVQQTDKGAEKSCI